MTRLKVNKTGQRALPTTIQKTMMRLKVNQMQRALPSKIQRVSQRALPTTIQRTMMRLKVNQMQTQRRWMKAVHYYFGMKIEG